MKGLIKLNKNFAYAIAANMVSQISEERKTKAESFAKALFAKEQKKWFGKKLTMEECLARGQREFRSYAWEQYGVCQPVVDAFDRGEEVWLTLYEYDLIYG